VLLSLPREMSQLIVLVLSSNLPLVRSFYSERNWYCFNMCVFALRHAAVRPRFAIEFGMTVYQTFYVFPIFRVWTLSRSSGTSRCKETTIPCSLYHTCALYGSEEAPTIPYHAAHTGVVGAYDKVVRHQQW